LAIRLRIVFPPNPAGSLNYSSYAFNRYTALNASGLVRFKDDVCLIGIEYHESTPPYLPL